MPGVSSPFDWRAKYTNFKIVEGQIEMPGERNGEKVSPSPADIVSSLSRVWGRVLAYFRP